jgi:hypothetical protein
MAPPGEVDRKAYPLWNWMYKSWEDGDFGSLSEDRLKEMIDPMLGMSDEEIDRLFPDFPETAGRSWRTPLKNLKKLKIFKAKIHEMLVKAGSEDIGEVEGSISAGSGSAGGNRLEFKMLHRDKDLKIDHLRIYGRSLPELWSNVQEYFDSHGPVKEAWFEKFQDQGMLAKISRFMDSDPELGREYLNRRIEEIDNSPKYKDGKWSVEIRVVRPGR